MHISAVRSKILCLVASFLPAVAIAQGNLGSANDGMSAEELLELCALDGSRDDRLICISYIRGVLDGLQLFRNEPLHCATWDVGAEELMLRVD